MFLSNMNCIVLFTKLFPRSPFSPERIEMKKVKLKMSATFLENLIAVSHMISIQSHSSPRTFLTLCNISPGHINV